MTATYLERPLIPPGACTWCGHPPHPNGCGRQIQVDVRDRKPVLNNCPCTRPLPDTTDTRTEGASS